jgi:hypothetical protein
LSVDPEANLLYEVVEFNPALRPLRP